MLIVTSDDVPGREITETLGLVVANRVRARNLGRDILAGLKSLVGGEIGAYRQLLIETREAALADLNEEAEKLGADAIVALRIAGSDVAANAAEVYVYGTAVKLA